MANPRSQVLSAGDTTQALPVITCGVTPPAIVLTVPLDGAPYGVAVSPDGVVYAALIGTSSLARGDVAAMTFASTATAHAALALAFGLGARRLRQRPGGSERQAQLEVLEAEVNDLRRELSEAQERLDFTERMLAQGLESRRVTPER